MKFVTPVKLENEKVSRKKFTIFCILKSKQQKYFLDEGNYEVNA